MNRNFYILNRSNQSFGVYLDFESTFPRFDNNPGFAGGLVTFVFDPEYATNGIFYTVHTENPAKGSVSEPVNPNAVLPAGYSATTSQDPPAGTVGRHAVLVEWHDTNVANAVFEGTARELLRVGFNGTIHPMGDLIFNPLAQPGDADYRNLYISMGDGGAGELPTNDDGVPGVTGGDRHYFPQRLDSLVGKILRITPDLNLRPGDALSSNERYRIPSTGTDPNPFSATNGARGEIFAVGFRNPHRMSWDTVSNKLIATDIGRFTFEEVNIIQKGGNYGWASREGTRSFFPTKSSGDWPPGTDTDVIPVPDTIFIRLNNSNTLGTITPIYPVAEFYQDQGDAVSSGFVYRGTLIPQLIGKYVWGDITTARLFYCDLAEMISATDTNPATLAAVHELQVVFNSPYDTPNQGVTNRRMFSVVAEEYAQRGGNAPGSAVLPGGAAVTGGNDPDGIPYGGGRADIRIAQGGDGELYLLSKSDGLIRQFVATPRPIIAAIPEPGQLTWNSAPGWVYRLQYKTNLSDINWTDVVPDITATATSTTNSLPTSDPQRFYRVRTVP